MASASRLLEIENLHVHFETREGTIRALNGVDLQLRRGETLGLVGESGCGKSMTARAILNMVPRPGRIVQGSIRFTRAGGPAEAAKRGAGTLPDTVDITALDPEGSQVRRIRGKEIAMVFQEPMSSLSPVHTVGAQIIEAIRLHQGVDRRTARDRVSELLDLVGIPDAKSRIDTYPFQLSGGMRQRVMIAMALSCHPSLLIADEPTTALDVTVQAQILELLQRMQRQFNMAILMITHNLGIVAAVADRVAVMYMGRIVEEAPVHQIFGSPKHPYTQGLLKSVPRVGESRGRRLWAIEGSVPNAYAKITGCAFYGRCRERIADVCDVGDPPLLAVGREHKVRCFLYAERERAVGVAMPPDRGNDLTDAIPREGAP